ncbi:hypothetical protein EYF80_005850 [Liparis tanakae]|uniref:Uncharacterized protein n=1 Tax=Liparis tanakae TaxID=230148 RepID=A0A4Z2J190_9TELE|nr:hypothetical protein EYF80_005850 [Liparis tanakae]
MELIYNRWDEEEAAELEGSHRVGGWAIGGWLGRRPEAVSLHWTSEQANLAPEAPTMPTEHSDEIAWPGFNGPREELNKREHIGLDKTQMQQQPLIVQDWEPPESSQTQKEQKH